MNEVQVRSPKSILKSDAIASEARLIATELIQIELEKQSLPLPKDSSLEIHIEALLETRPDLLSLAAERIEAKSDAYSRSLRAIGIEPQFVETFDLE